MNENAPQDTPEKKSASSVITLAVIGLLLAAFVLFIKFYPEGERTEAEKEYGRRPKEGSPAPDFTLADVDGKQWTLSQLKGTAVVINFWATWCPPCRQEMPSLSALNERNAGNKNFKILTILYRDDPETAKSYFEGKGFTMPILLDSDSAIARTYGITAVPETYIIDKKGILRKTIIGPTEFDTPTAIAFFEGLARE